MTLKLNKVVVGVSGGVDSAVAALLLKNKGFDVHGVFMQNWDIADEQGQCSADKDYKDASIVCNKLGIALHYVNFVKHYWNHVFCNFLKDYETGFTPNPDILCNRHVKFDQFILYARKYLDADAVATGHYAQTNFGPFLENFNSNKQIKLLRASCTQKDQTFFLSQVKQESLRRVMFPLGQMMKAEVKQMAIDNGLHKIASKKESMGICFIGSRNFQNFISEYIDNKPGIFVDLNTNKIMGTHQGIHQWTVGQRSRLSSYNKSSYIACKVPETNIIYVVNNRFHYSLYSDLFTTSEAHWIESRPAELTNGGILKCDFKFQHVEVLQKCWVFENKRGLVVTLPKSIRALTAGQYAVFYKDNECLGSARIIYTGPSKYFYFKYRRKCPNNKDRINEKKSDYNKEEIIEESCKIEVLQ